MVPCAEKVVSQNREKYFIPSAIYFTKSLSPPNGPPANSTDREVTEPSEGKKASSDVSLINRESGPDIKTITIPCKIRIDSAGFKYIKSGRDGFIKKPRFGKTQLVPLTLRAYCPRKFHFKPCAEEIALR